ncbi:Molybdopterin synthase catalytic subunit [Vibrio nigripulchritudo SFn27]|uniref:Molybdopterin synthase catalytic subunit n=1 Tax=Vibrio nigripulchritudo TaxID=28173 RepID=U4K3D1_9VIBR|nr:molybdopterin synthase catalytic subunit MoaE [Vibrio nigripulchritudo]CCN82840.1 Molybdopterin synthase catalytic subunit [Vibrio nigripulchritudo BLFn1]CCN90048.1 Molybdopterin synthase catalytic subunit [Vibrio nigripulchritudo SFn27]CCN97198.1 Molybdopterin synthase catalytic subunit [Vibrio nigripulchritudo ENn2]CCO42105.1 Molybdopterin synthase catalytic subunit [Vibrio nigripulchritudo SFn135]CCO55328.1 Molybdopterin synthase catalytic subunit [Vibrio nigripulchritudo Wn13]
MSQVSVQKEDFSLADEYEVLAQGTSSGAVVTFVGKVRDMNLGDNVIGLSLEHYPGMTEKSLESLCEQAKQRWSIENIRVIHRVGDLDIGDQIVFVGVSSAHRGDAFNACEFVMDYLKTQAPFWKKERTTDSVRWVESRESDAAAASRWAEQGE